VINKYTLLFEAALGIDAQPLISMQADYNIQVTRNNKIVAARLAKIYKVAVVV
jgi:plasmid maintenance system antidote protein VapI